MTRTPRAAFSITTEHRSGPAQRACWRCQPTQGPSVRRSRRCRPLRRQRLWRRGPTLLSDSDSAARMASGSALLANPIGEKLGVVALGAAHQHLGALQRQVSRDGFARASNGTRGSPLRERVCHALRGVSDGRRPRGRRSNGARPAGPHSQDEKTAGSQGLPSGTPGSGSERDQYLTPEPRMPQGPRALGLFGLPTLLRCDRGVHDLHRGP